MAIFAIDPGTTESAFVLYDQSSRRVVEKGTEPNEFMLSVIDRFSRLHLCAIEMVASYGMAVGAEVFETVYWIGRFAERWAQGRASEARRVFRREVKLYLCGTSAAKDPNVRQALIDRFGPGKELAIGKKSTPGPLFGVSGDVWAALAVAVTVAANPR